ncbi:MAG: chemotaxis protein CheA [Clostridiales bacterium]|jgi:two-component system chemotaxis sensor kinase CheA|nr:chemotaxis protein CheA [Clostridiales bacterium]
MAADNSLMDMFVFETTQLIDQLENILIDSESNGISSNIDEIFRIMHTIKGSAAMMMFDDISHLAHSIEDMFFFLREKNPTNVDYAKLTDLVLDGMDFIKSEIDKIQQTGSSDAKSDAMRERIRQYLEELKAAQGGGAAPGGTGAGAGGQAPAGGAGAVAGGAGGASGGGAGAGAAGGADDDIFAPYEFAAQDGYAHIIRVWFEDGSGMENLRAFELTNRLQNIATELRHIPSDMDGEAAAAEIQANGATIIIASELEREDVAAYVEQTPLLKKYDISTKALRQDGDSEPGGGAHGAKPAGPGAAQAGEGARPDGGQRTAAPGAGAPGAQGDGGQAQAGAETGGSGALAGSGAGASAGAGAAASSGSGSASGSGFGGSGAAGGASAGAGAAGAGAAGAADSGGAAGKQGIISVNISKLDKLMNLVGELVTSESMVSQNPDLNGLQLDNFNKAARQLQKIINELQDVSMSVRMVPLSLTFQKMHRIVRDMCRKLGKEVNLEIIGEETEVDKNIIEQITNPLMHLIRNSVDHGIEMPGDREGAGKRRAGTVTLEAKNESGDVWIIVKDDGRGLDKGKIYEKARRLGVTSKSRDELSDREINQFILAAGFSTNEAVTEYSGRGVGMDVVVKGIENVGGSVALDSAEGEGTQISIKIPLTLAIMDGMIVNVGETNFVIPITSIKESFKASEKYNIADVNGEDIIMIRGEPNPIIRLRDRFMLNSKAESYYDGIMIMVENETNRVCLYVDAIVGQRQVVVKPLPGYIKEVRGISGCTLLGDGSISLILDVAEFLV